MELIIVALEDEVLLPVAELPRIILEEIMNFRDRRNVDKWVKRMPRLSLKQSRTMKLQGKRIDGRKGLCTYERFRTAKGMSYVRARSCLRFLLPHSDVSLACRA
jgi:hypothetical protein